MLALTPIQAEIKAKALTHTHTHVIPKAESLQTVLEQALQTNVQELHHLCFLFLSSCYLSMRCIFECAGLFYSLFYM